jgi:cell division protein ZapA
MESVTDKQPVRVTILSRPYVLRTADDPREVEALASSVNELMLSIAARAPNADSTHIAVLACLHLADRLRLMEHELSSLKERVDRKSGEFAALIDRLMLDQLIPSSEPDTGDNA